MSIGRVPSRVSGRRVAVVVLGRPRLDTEIVEDGPVVDVEADANLRVPLETSYRVLPIVRGYMLDNYLQNSW